MQRPVVGRILRQRNKKVRFLVPSDEHVLAIRRHTHDFDPWSRCALQTESLPDRIFAGPELMRHRLIHDGNKGRVFIVVLAEGTPAKQWNSHGIEIRRVNVVVNHHRRLLARRQHVPFDVNRAPVVYRSHRHAES